MIAKHINLLMAAAENVARNPRGYLVAASGLLVGLTLLLSGVAISEGLKAEALASVQSGGDVYCTWDMFGRDAPIPRNKVEFLTRLQGVRRAVPRIIGRIPVCGELAVLVGVSLDSLRAEPISVDGALPQNASEVLIGFELARKTGLKPGETVLLEGDSNRLFTISGVVAATSSLWSAKAIVCELEEAAIVFGEGNYFSDVCLYTRPGYENLVAEAIERTDPRYRVQTRAIVNAYVLRGMTLREGAFTALFALAMVLAIPSYAVMTYLGHTPRRREIGLLKADGWSTTDVLEMVSLENLIVSLGTAATAMLLAILWVKVLRAPIIGPFFLPDLPLFPAMEIPSQFLPLPFFLSLTFCLVVTMTGSIFTTWKTAISRPVEVLR